MRFLMAFWAHLIMANVWAAAGKPWAFAGFALMAAIAYTLYYVEEYRK